MASKPGSTRIGRVPALWVCCLAAAMLAAVATPLPAGADPSFQTVGPRTRRDGQCTDAYVSQGHDSVLGRVSSHVDRWQNGFFQECADQAPRPPGNIRIAMRLYTNGAGPCAPQNQVSGLNNDGFYLTNSTTTHSLVVRFENYAQGGLSVVCNQGTNTDNWLTADIWANVHSWRAPPAAWIGRAYRPATGHFYPVLQA